MSHLLTFVYLSVCPPVSHTDRIEFVLFQKFVKHSWGVMYLPAIFNLSDLVVYFWETNKIAFIWSAEQSKDSLQKSVSRDIILSHSFWLDTAILSFFHISHLFQNGLRTNLTGKNHSHHQYRTYTHTSIIISLLVLIHMFWKFDPHNHFVLNLLHPTI